MIANDVTSGSSDDDEAASNSYVRSKEDLSRHQISENFWRCVALQT